MTEVLLAIFERLPPELSQQRDSLLLLAESTVGGAERQARDVEDVSGDALAQLAHARLDRLAGHNVDRPARIKRILDVAKRLDDVALLIQGFTTLGDEYDAQGLEEAALDCYRQALNATRGTEVPVLGTFARRKLMEALSRRN